MKCLNDYKLQSSEVNHHSNISSVDTAGGVFLPNPIPTAYPPSAVAPYQKEEIAASKDCKDLINCENDGVPDDECYDDDFW